MQEVRKAYHHRSRQHLASIVPNSGAPAPRDPAGWSAPHQSPLPWLNVLTFWPLLDASEPQG